MNESRVSARASSNSRKLEKFGCIRDEKKNTGNRELSTSEFELRGASHARRVTIFHHVTPPAFRTRSLLLLQVDYLITFSFLIQVAGGKRRPREGNLLGRFNLLRKRQNLKKYRLK